MFFQESELLQSERIQYSCYIEQIDTFLYHLDIGEHEHLDIEVVSDIIGISERIIEIVFEDYCSKGLLKTKYFLVCPKEQKIIREAQPDVVFPFVEYCELCEKEHTLHQKHLVKRYSTMFTPISKIGAEKYESILECIQNTGLQMERTPHRFANLEEEALRDLFLVPLSGNFQGNATGETFNNKGKTDILLRENGLNLFIAECKFWAGEGVFIETIQQLLKYVNWRDTKTAIIIFDRNKDHSSVLHKISETIQKHPNCRKYLGAKNNCRFKCALCNPVDDKQLIDLAAFAFHLYENNS